MKRLLTCAATGLLSLAGLAFAATPANAAPCGHWDGHHASYHGGWGHHHDWDHGHHRYWYPQYGRYWYPNYGAYSSPYVYSPYYVYPNNYSFGYAGPYVNFWVTQ